MPVAGQGIVCPEVRRAGHSVGSRGRAWMDRVGDEVLVKRVASGDERALSDLYDRYKSLVYGTGMRLLGDRETAEELVQDVFTSVWKNSAGFDPARPLRGRSVLRAVARRGRRTSQRRELHGRSERKGRRKNERPGIRRFLPRRRRNLRARQGPPRQRREKSLRRAALTAVSRDIDPHRTQPGPVNELVFVASARGG